MPTVSRMVWLISIGIAAVVVPFDVAADDNVPELPPSQTREISFRDDIAPILRGSCVKCHTGNEAKGGFRLETRELLLKGGESGLVLNIGKSGESEFIRLVAGLEKDRIMPAQGPRLKPEQISLLRGWIDQGLRWDAGFRFKSVQQMPLEPRIVALPDSAAATNPIDLLLQSYLSGHSVDSQELVSDRVFARRVYLDLVGQLPPREAVVELERDTAKDKRQKMVRQLLRDKPAYAQHWLTFWNDQLRNAYRGTGFIDNGRQPITDWLYKSLYDNKPYDRFVHELISPVPGSEGFTNGIIWRGVVNASQRREMQAAQNIGQVFLGTNLKCASCHDSFVNHWKLTDAYGLAAVFAEGPLEIHRCDKPAGELAQVKFIYPQLGEIDATAPRAQRMKQLADLMIHPRNGRVPRVIVNRLWAQLMGQGLVEPLDDLDQVAWHQDLLDWLAVDFVEHKYDLKHTLELICTSRAYQMLSVGAPTPDAGEFVFRGPIIKRMSAEQFVDAVAGLTGAPVGQQVVKVPVAVNSENHEVQLSGKWIWNDADAAKGTNGGRVFFRKSFEVTELPSRAIAVIACDNEFTLFLNGKQVAAGEDWSSPSAVNLLPQLIKGRNVLAVEAINWPDLETKKGLSASAPNPAGLAVSLAYQLAKSPWETLETDKSWLASTKPAAGWQTLDFDTQGWEHAQEVGGFGEQPWSLAPKLEAELAAGIENRSGAQVGVRTALVNDDALTRALGRPNREQVVTRRDSLATTLQALELTNGSTLDEMLKKGAQKWLLETAGKRQQASEIVASIYLAALGRQPSSKELAAARELLGEQPTSESLEDFLWIITMLPEFQLVY